MATMTSLLGLTKPAYTEAADIAVLNTNFDLIDKAVGQGSRVANLLDNSDFSAARFIAHAGLNGKHGADTYLGDRWKGSTSITPTQYASGVLLETSAQYTYVYQKIKVQQGKRYTFAIHAINMTGTHRIATYNGNNSVIYTQDYAADRELLITTFTAGEDVVSVLYYPGFANGGGSAVLQWAALYEGAYTAETLPAYVYKGYAAELAECQRYYLRIKNGRWQYCTSSGTTHYFVGNFMFPTTMRVTPTITFDSATLMNIGAVSAAVYSIDENGLYQLSCTSGSTPSGTAWLSMSGAASADL